MWKASRSNRECAQRSLMVPQRELRKLSQNLEATTQTPHFKGAAFRISNNHATLPTDETAVERKEGIIDDGNL